jgi:hypothetical protein
MVFNSKLKLETSCEYKVVLQKDFGAKAFGAGNI